MGSTSGYAQQSLRGSLHQRSDAEQRLLDDYEWTVEGSVDALIPEFGQVELVDSEGQSFAITEHTQGVDWSSLHEGQRLRCRVRGVLTPRVLSATVLA